MSGIVRADPPVPPPPRVVVYQPLAQLQPWEPTANQVVATTEAEFVSLVAQFSTDPDFVGTIIITDGPAPGGTWPPCTEGTNHVWLRFNDLSYYQNVWLPSIQSGWTPGYAQGIEADPAPKASQAVCTVRQWSVDDPSARSNEHRRTLMRIAKTGGAFGVVWSVIEAGDPNPLPKSTLSATGCDAGPWWPTCCRTQELFCNLLCGWMRLLGISICDSCVQNCDNCSVANPCHSCDPCGLTWLLCQFVPGAHC